MGTLRNRVLGSLAAVGLVAAPLALGAAASVAAPVSAASTATVANGQELRDQWATGANTVITLTADIDLGVDGGANPICDGGEPVRTGGTGTITVDGQGLYGITQTCDAQRVLRDDTEDETVNLTGLTHFTGGDAQGHGGGLRADGPVNVTNSDLSGNAAHQTEACLENAGSSNTAGGEVANSIVLCEDGDGGAIYTASLDLAVIAGYDVTITGSNVANNTADDDGGGVYTSGTVTVTDSTVDGNTALGYWEGGGRGGGAYAEDGASVTGSTFSANQALCNAFDGAFCLADADGGGLHTYGTATIGTSTFTLNHAYDSGGGVYSRQGATVTDSMFSGNQAGGESEEAAAAQAPAVIQHMMHATDSAGSANCDCSGGGILSTGATEVTGSTFVANGAGCNESCLGSGGAIASFGELTVTGSTFGDAADPEANSNAAGCFFGCGAMGGAIFALDTATVSGSTFTYNGNGCVAECNALGGAIYQGIGFGSGSLGQYVPDTVEHELRAQVSGPGALSVDTSLFSLNEAGCFSPECFGAGGAIWSDSAPTVGVTASTFDTNDALFTGGAIAVNDIFRTGGVTCAATCGGTDVTITNSTITGNKQGFAAAVQVASVDDTLTLVHDTIDGNKLVSHDELSPVSVPDELGAQCECEAANVIAASLTSFGTDITHPIDERLAPDATVANCNYLGSTSEGYNYSDDDSCGFTEPTDDAAEGNDPQLTALADNGGPTPTMLPLIGTSPLIDAIPIADCDPDVTVDQRGVSRPQAKGCDIGAVEVKAASVQVTKDVTGLGGATTLPFAGPYVFDVACSDGTVGQLTVADPFGGTSDTLGGIVPGATCTVVEESIVIVGIPVGVTYDPVGVDSAGIALDSEDTADVVVTNDFAEVLAVLGAIANLQPRFTG